MLYRCKLWAFGLFNGFVFASAGSIWQLASPRPPQTPSSFRPF
jgi:hypothetical protein